MAVCEIRIVADERIALADLLEPHRRSWTAADTAAEPRCSGICVPCAKSRTRREQGNRAVARPRTFVENEDRTSVASISSVMDMRRWLKTSIAIGC